MKKLCIAGFIGLGLTFITSCSSVSESDSETVADVMPGFVETGNIEKCIAFRPITEKEVLDERHILFETRDNQLYMSTLKNRCRELTQTQYKNFSIVFEYGSMTSICEDYPVYLGIGATAVSFSGCNYGKFREVTRVE